MMKFYICKRCPISIQNATLDTSLRKQYWTGTVPDNKLEYERKRQKNKDVPIVASVLESKKKAAVLKLFESAGL